MNVLHGFWPAQLSESRFMIITEALLMHKLDNKDPTEGDEREDEFIISDAWKAGDINRSSEFSSKTDWRLPDSTVCQ